MRRLDEVRGGRSDPARRDGGAIRRPRSAGPRRGPAHAARLAAHAASGLGLLLGLVLGACRGEPAAFVAVDRPPAPRDTLRLTFSAGDDRAPTWLGDDTVLYAGAGFAGVPGWTGLLLAQPLATGVSQPYMPLLYAPGLTGWLTTPQRDAAAARVVFGGIDESRAATVTPCGNTHAVSAVDPGIPVSPPGMPPLIRGHFRVRAPEQLPGTAVEPWLDLDFAGFEEKTVAELPLSFLTPDQPRWRVDLYPFQVDFAAGGPIAFRPSFSPDGAAIAFSDGLRLLIWHTAAGTVAPVPGGDGLLSAAWSPAGDWIATARPILANTTTSDYAYADNVTGRVDCGARFVKYHLTGVHVVLVKPDGSAQRDLGEGTEPAWAPDGSAVFVTRADGIWRVPLAGGSGSLVPGTAGGTEPAVSPDGRRLAFTRVTAAGNHDIYVVPLAP